MLRMVLGIAIAVTAFMPTVGMADDQAIADYIKARLQTEQQRGNLRGFNVDMRVDRGIVWFKGHVANEAQEKAILSSAQSAGHLGVVQVVDDIEISGEGYSSSDYSMGAAQVPQRDSTTTQQVGYQQPLGGIVPPTPTQAQLPPTAAQAYNNSVPMPFARAAGPGGPIGPQGGPGFGPQGGPGFGQGGPGYGQVPAALTSAQLPGSEYPVYGGGYGGEIISGPIDGGFGVPVDAGFSGGGAPVPVAGGFGGGGAGGGYESPNLPGYAWPGYAANPNYAALSYPQQYSPSAWPYIGPFYPYPQVPLGWRKVTLEWDDGWWMLDFKDK